MKHISTFLLTTLMSMVSTMVFAHDIEVTNSDGKTIYYNYNSDSSSVSVTFQGASTTIYPNEYSGEIVIPETVTYGGKTYSVTSIESAFDGCSGLTSVTIPTRVTSIGNSAFSGCSGLTSVTIPNSVTSIGKNAFYGCSGLTSVTWNAKNYPAFSSSSLNPFYNIRTQITEFIIGDEVTSIPAYMCYGMSNLKSVTLPTSVTSIGSYAFSICSGLTSIKVANGNNIYDSRNDCNAVIETASNTIIIGCKTTIIPTSVTSIGTSAFYGCSGLTSVTIGNSVTSIGDYAFSGCSGLTSVTIPNSVTSIGGYAFWNCSSLTSVTIPNSVTSIGEYNQEIKGVTNAEIIPVNA